MDEQRNFGAADYVIFFGTLGFSFFIGVFFAFRSKKKNTPSDYFLAGRKLSVLPAAFSFVVTYQSSLMLIGTPAEVYAYGLKYGYFVIGASLSYIFAGLTLVPVFHPLQLTSVYKYFQLRYHGNAIRFLAMTIGIVYYIFYMATVTFGTCVALEVIVGIPYWGTILIYTFVTAVYTSIGGMKAVIWTDVFQLVIMFTGVFGILIKSTIDVGGSTKVFELAASRVNMADFRVDPTVRYHFWNLSICTFTMYLAGCYQQPGVQRINSTPDVKSARRLYAISGPLYGIFALVVCFEGVTIYAYYAMKRCDPLGSNRIDGINEIVPVAILDLFSSLPGLSGLFIASLSSAALSTLSSSLSSLAAVTYEDILKMLYPTMSDERSTLISKIVVLCYGIVAMAVTFLIAQIPGSIVSVFFAFMGCLDGPTCAMFLLSTMYRRATTKGVFTGAIVGMAFAFWLNMGQTFSNIPPSPKLPHGPIDMCSFNDSDVMSNLTYDVTTTNYDSMISVASNITQTVNSEIHLSPIQKFYTLSYVNFSLFSCLISIIVAVIISAFTKPPENIDERCLFSFRKHIMESLLGYGGQKRYEVKREGKVDEKLNLMNVGKK